MALLIYCLTAKNIAREVCASDLVVEIKLTLLGSADTCVMSRVGSPLFSWRKACCPQSLGGLPLYSQDRVGLPLETPIKISALSQR